MQTPSHLILSAALQYPLRKRRLPFSASGFLLGSVLPDLPFTLLTIIYGLYYRLSGISVPAPGVMEYLHFDLFFNDPVWIAAHNTPHSLVVGGLLAGIGLVLIKRGRSPFLFWLSASMMLHTTIDIFTHMSDGPLFLFPLNWTYRYVSPVSYWESGIWFMALEYVFNALLLVYIGRNWLAQRKAQGQHHVTA